MCSPQVLVSLLLSLFFLVLVSLGLGLSPGAGFAPMTVGAIGLVLALSQAWSDYRNFQAAVPDRRNPAALRMMAWVTTLVALVLVLGITFGGFVFIAAWLKRAARQSWVQATGIAAMTTLSIYVVFERLIGLVLFEGLIFT